jgi:hypothetical protein
MHEQQRVDSLSRANREAEAEIAALRASVQEQQQKLKQLEQSLAAAGVASPCAVAEPASSGGAVQPTSADGNRVEKEQYMSARDQLLWEEQQRTIV